VNSLRRLRYAEAIGCDSADGTFLTFAPDANFVRLMRWINHMDTEQAMFGMVES